MTAAKKRPLARTNPRAKRNSGTFPIARDRGSINEPGRPHTSHAGEDPFLAMVAHDLRGPLGAVLGAAQLLARSTDLPDSARQGVYRILRSGERMRRLVGELLDAERARQPGGLRVSIHGAHDLRSLVARIVDEVRGKNPDRWIIQRDEGPVIADFDEDRIEQVVSNLVGNAVVHGNPHRPVVVSVDSDETSAWISVHNHGTPIPPELMRVLFDPFQRACVDRAESGGLGLGLYIADRIMAAHGGCVSVSSTANAGTRFVASFPRRAHRVRDSV